MSGGNWIKVNEIERGQYPHVKVDHVPVTCSHCDEAACVKLDQTGAIYRRPDGIVLIDPEKAKGNKELVKTLPLSPDRVERRARSWPRSAPSAPISWTRASRSPAAWSPAPRARCVFGDLDDPASAVAKLVAAGATEVLHPEYAMGEKVTYRNLPKKFVAGTVIYGDIDEVAKDVEVILSGDGTTLTTKTNGFGDFEFEGLPDEHRLHGQGRGPRLQRGELRGQDLQGHLPRRDRAGASEGRAWPE